MRFHIVGPVKLPRLRVQAMDEAGEVAHEKQARVRVNGHRRNAPMDFVVAPNLAALRDVPRLGRVNTRENAYSLPMLRVLPHRDIDPVFVEDWRRIDLARSF